MLDSLIAEPIEAVLQLLAEALDHIDIGIILLDPNLRVRFVNRRMADLFGYTPALLATEPQFRELVQVSANRAAPVEQPDQLAAYIAQREASIRAGPTPPTQIDLGDGRRVLFSCAVCGDGGRILTYADISQELRREAEHAEEQMSAELRFNSEILEDQGAYLAALAETADENARKVELARLELELEVGERRRLESELRRQACTDGLTGVLNRAGFMATAQRELELAQATDECLSVLMLDIDHFKKINDRCGHAGGDLALQHLVAILRSGLRESDLLGRLGGEEFAIVLPTASPRVAGDVAERLRGRVQAASLAFGENEIAMTVSVGVSACQAADRMIEPVIARADVALYRAKNSGRNRVEMDPTASCPKI